MPVVAREKASEKIDKKLGAAFIVLALFFLFEYLRPQSYSLFPVIQPLRIPLVLTVFLFVVFLKSDKTLVRDKLIVYVGLFIFLVGLSVTYANNTFYVWVTFRDMLVTLVTILLVMPVICDNGYKTRKFFYIWMVINLLLAIYGIAHSGHGPSGFLWDENDFSLAINMCIPLPFYLMLSPDRNKLEKYLLLGATVVLVISSGATMSRGGFLGLVAALGMIWLTSERKFKSLSIILLCIMILGYPVYKLVPVEFKDEMSTIFDSKDKTRGARIEFWGLGWEMFLDNPVLGVGAQNYPWTVHAYQMKRPDYTPDSVTLLGGRLAHSLYFTLIPELGLAGIIVYFLILKHIFRKLGRVIVMAQDCKTMAEYGLIAKWLRVSTITYLVTGAFISVLYYPPFWYLVGFVITLDRAARIEYEKAEKKHGNEAECNSHNRNSRAWRGREGARPDSRWAAR